MGSKEQLKIDVLLLLFQKPAGLPVTSLPYEFLHFHGRPLDLQAHGYPSLGALLTDMSSMVELRSSGGGGLAYSLRLLLRVPGQLEEPSRPRAPVPGSRQPSPLLLRAPLFQGWPRWVPVQPLPWARSASMAAVAAPARGEEGEPGTRDHSPVTASGEAAPMGNGEKGHPKTYSEVLRSGGPAGGRSLAGGRPKLRPGLQADKAGDPAAQSHDKRAASRKAPPTDCPVKEWLLSVLKTPGFRDGLHSRKLASLCLRQLRQELPGFLSENRYGSLSELLACVPEAEMVPARLCHSDYVIRLRASSRSQPGGGPCLTTNSPSAVLPHAAPGSSFPQPAPSAEVTESIPERVSLLLTQHPGGLSAFQLRQAYREAYQRGLALEGHPSLGALLGAMGSAVSVRGLGVQARLFPRAAPGCSILAEPGSEPFQQAGDGTSVGSRQLSAELPEWTITETGFHASAGLSSPS